MPAKIEIPNIDNLISRYVAGEPEQKLAREFGVSRPTIRRRLIEFGIQPRNISQSMHIMQSKLSDAERLARAAKAQATRRGQVDSDSVKAKRANTRERLALHGTEVETVLAERLRKSHYRVTQQKAVGIYNVDVAIESPRVAVEIFGGHFHASGRHAARHHKRVKYLLDSGWHVVIVWADAKHYPVSDGCYDYLRKFANEMRRNPSPSRQYRVILGNGNPAPAISHYLNGPTDIERFGSGAD